jgi:hypothetical protein
MFEFSFIRALAKFEPAKELETKVFSIELVAKFIKIKL